MIEKLHGIKNTCWHKESSNHSEIKVVDTKNCCIVGLITGFCLYLWCH